MENDGNRVSEVLLIACGALARELRLVLGQLVGVKVDVRYLPSALHNRPERIPGEVDAILDQLPQQGKGVRVLLGYADCGTGGLLDALITRRRHQGMTIDRLPGAHCYEFFAGSTTFAELTEQSLGTFYLTDYLALHFDALVWTGLGLDRHPQLRDAYFGNYDRVVLISQSRSDEVMTAAQGAAERLSLEFRHEHVGLDRFGETLHDVARRLVEETSNS